MKFYTKEIKNKNNNKDTDLERQAKIHKQVQKKVEILNVLYVLKFRFHSKNEETIYISYLLNKGSTQYIFFLGKYFKKNTEYFLKFLFLFESTILAVTNGK